MKISQTCADYLLERGVDVMLGSWVTRTCLALR
jgi:hypothetical protein